MKNGRQERQFQSLIGSFQFNRQSERDRQIVRWSDRQEWHFPIDSRHFHLIEITAKEEITFTIGSSPIVGTKMVDKDQRWQHGFQSCERWQGFFFGATLLPWTTRTMSVYNFTSSSRPHKTCHGVLCILTPPEWSCTADWIGAMSWAWHSNGREIRPGAPWSPWRSV